MNMEKDTFINYMIDMEATGKNIRSLMKMTGYTARELEKLIGCTQMTFFNWQEGKNLPSFDNLLRLAGILKVPMEKIVVFKKFEAEDLPLKESNSGCIRNNVFFTYNSATECVIRDCLAFKKKFGVYPDKMMLNPETLKKWENRAIEESAVSSFETDYELETVSGKLSIDSGNAYVKTDSFEVELMLNDEIPVNYYRLIKTGCCKTY